ncbi:exopolysaccharide biosynthesis protein [Lutimaribacter sp. EGI FJ00015]|uniref:Exopolysaccharide biosynthesis protein n=1 Tax=Lutimaribacter degradans TaxID=2945989 RepID=A0ACC5ZWV7_9RHOB|nr:exopolysaccharide biosynthesis protein [Lutimaribacter sp. EGI FJ00013]MCM2562838.1 exopolysaccharide biosynthesis protein [Lutimaribacter sp. EGI FJ00013]MCO0613995.1 exopolysaccharide biosynthesis protein [Lutimaribacter sp. EGI FJ00015]MCO0636967.1 exopolysaccharide biosynthesis protein [Lutimaribacter sp. EGI FJ00014]
MTAPGPDSLRALLEALRPDEGDEHISLRQIIGHVGDRSFSGLVLLIGLILVSPLSAIPGAPTMGMLIIVTTTSQYLLGRDHLWLPAMLLDRSLDRDRVERAIDFLHKPLGWVDRRTRRRLPFLTHRPLKWLVVLTIMATALPWPLLEPLPMVTSIGATAISLLSIGLVTRDGLFVVLGYAFLGALGVTLFQVWGAIW